MTQDQLCAECKEWQWRLRLQDWKVEVRWCSRWEIEPSQAQVAYCKEKKHARITIGRPEEYDPSESGVKDWEHHLVHELLHLHFWWDKELEKGTAEYDLHEQAINTIAEALVGLKSIRFCDPSITGEADGEG